MSDIIKTTLFVAVAAVLAGIAGLNHYLNQPSNSAEFVLVGKPFFEAYDSTENIASLEVSAIDPVSGELKQFIVRKKDGLWTIPTHFDYPAEAASRLAETGSSVMGIEREALVGRLASEHPRLGVVDPLSSDLEDPEEAGQRITLKDANDDVVVDLIIGKEAQSDQPRPEDMDIEAVRAEPRQTYYVRRPDEQQTYQVQLDIDLSTQFSDWIDPDLLRIEPSDLRQIRVNNYSVEKTNQNGVLGLMRSQGDQLLLTRATDVDPWVLDEINADAETLDSDRVDEIVRVLDELKIAGVRPKFKYKGQLLLTPDLKLNQQPEYQAGLNQMVAELDSRGFSLSGTTDDLQLVSTNGDLTIGTDRGVVYTLSVGREIKGDEQEIEIGGTSQNEGANDDAATEAEAAADPADEQSDAPNRFLMVRVAFDENLVADRPVAPTEPVAPMKPEGYQPAKPAEQATDSDSEAPDDVQPPADESDQSAEQEIEERKPEFVAYDKAVQDYEEQKLQYELAFEKYQEDLKAFQDRVNVGKEKVEELNQRFAEWYYVVTADNLKTLQSTRDDLVNKKTETTDPTQTIPSRPNIQFPDTPSLPPVEAPGAVEQNSENPDQEKAQGEGEVQAAIDPSNQTPVEMPEKGNGSEGDDSKVDPQNTNEDAKQQPEQNKPAEGGGEETESGESQRNQTDADPPAKTESGTESA